MRLIDSPREFREWAAGLPAERLPLALVPTQGALHDGHSGLVRAAREAGARSVAVSIFVNPLQYGPNEDPGRLPASPDRDLARCEADGVDAVFAPPVEAFLPRDLSTLVVEERRAAGLCAASRPQYFRGAVTVNVKLATLARPRWLVHGAVNAQLAAVTRRAFRDLDLPSEVLVGPTGRDADGLALASRLAGMTAGQRLDAGAIPRALRRGAELVEGGTRNVDRVLAEVTHVLSQVRRLRVLYVAAVDPETMEPRREIVPGHTLLMLAAWVDDVRLVDNLLA